MEENTSHTTDTRFVWDSSLLTLCDYKIEKIAPIF